MGGRTQLEGWSKRGSQRGHGGVGLNSGGGTRKAPDRTDGCLMREAVLWENRTYGCRVAAKRGLWRNCERTSQPRAGLETLRRVRAPVLYPTKPCRRIDMTETFYATQQVRALTGQGWPPADESSVAWSGARPRLRSVHRERRPRDRASKVSHAESTSLSLRRLIAGPVVAWVRRVRRGRRRGMYEGRPGTWDISSLHRQRRRGRRDRSGPGFAGRPVPASEGGRSGGSAERLKWRATGGEKSEG